MKQEIELFVTPSGDVIHKHDVHEVCAACGYDLTEEELQKAVCADCGAELEIKRSVAVYLSDITATVSVNL